MFIQKPLFHPLFKETKKATSHPSEIAFECYKTLGMSPLPCS